ncbi:MAG: Enhancer of polycomb-like protein 1 [Thelocarpon superellum]|nr:MAG: Enhancer of polycomb-like protein 1 [Thelocarpon superellum]
MTRAGAAGARFRQRKLSTKHSLQILREDQVEKVEDDQQRNIPKVDTGVEKGEEIEHHLQAAISASQAAVVGGKVAQIFIPTPDTIQSNIQYDRFYPLKFSQPATYIRFSSTVEDCSGCQYCMSAADDAFLKTLNQKKPVSSQCSEDLFEEVMDFFEQTARLKQPFAAVDNPPVVTWEEMESSFDETLEEKGRSLAPEIYPHWKARRLKRGNKTLMPGLKLETGQETDDSDPYICFRRREVRQVRKTRGRDAQSTEKLRKLRKELEDARQLISTVKQREMTRRELLAVERTLFEQRAQVKETKRKLGIKGDDEDLINQKPQKKKTPEVTQRPSGPQLRMPTRPDGRPPEAELILLKDTLAEKENAIQREIDQKIAAHREWNKGYLDLTRMPLTPVPEQGAASSFRTALTDYLPTPPGSESSDASGRVEHTDAASPTRGREPERERERERDTVVLRYTSPTFDGSAQKQPSFRRRIGRGGRVMIDRRGMRLQSTDGVDPRLLDRFKFDQDDDDELPVYQVDPFQTMRMRYRASIIMNHREYGAHRAAAAAARQIPHDASNSAAQGALMRPGVGPDGAGAQRVSAEAAANG